MQTAAGPKVSAGMGGLGLQVQRSVCCLGVTRCSFFIFLYFFSSISFSCCYLFLTPRILEIFLFGHFFACFFWCKRPVCTCYKHYACMHQVQACMQQPEGPMPRAVGPSLFAAGGWPQAFMQQTEGPQACMQQAWALGLYGAGGCQYVYVELKAGPRPVCSRRQVPDLYEAARCLQNISSAC